MSKVNKTVVAAIQMVSSANVADNLREAEGLISAAVSQGAKLVALPENFAYMGANDTDKLAIKEVEGLGPIQNFLAEQSSKHGIYIVAGTVPIASATANKVSATSLVYDDQGVVVARYDKIHLFDMGARLNDNYLGCCVLFSCYYHCYMRQLSHRRRRKVVVFLV